MVNMTSANYHKSGPLEHFYEHLSEDEWLDGIDLYQAGKVDKVNHYQSLISCTVRQEERGRGVTAEVRLKIHPSGKVIQWIECTCRKNRTYGQYCEHIAALMIHIDREKPEFFSHLDTKMPLKPPAVTKKLKLQMQQKAEGLEKKREKPAQKQRGASHALLDHLKGSIHQIRLISQGPCLRVRIEIKPGTLTNYDLDPDASAHFLRDNKDKEAYSPAVKDLKIYQGVACAGTRIFLAEDEKITVERVIGIKLTSAATVSGSPIVHTVGRHTRLESSEEQGKKEGLYAFIGVRSATKYCGKEYIFLPGKGYWPLEQNTVRQEWHEQPLSRSFRDDDAARLVDSAFEEYRNLGVVWLDSRLKQPKIDHLPQLSEIRICGEKDGWFCLDPRYGKGKDGISMSHLMLEAQKNKRKYVKNGDSWLKIPDFITQNSWTLDEGGQYLKVDALGLMRLKASTGDFDHFVGSQTILEKIRNQTEYHPATPPPDISQTRLSLREYQKEGLSWFWWLYRNQLHGLLADDMGLGKTHQAMGVMSAIQNEERELSQQEPVFLVICPTTVLEHWEDKVLDFAPNLKPLRYHGPGRASGFAEVGKRFFSVITSYGVLLRDIRRLSEVNWHAVILDEAHFVKNNNTATYRAACRLSSKIRLCLTGTPMENHLGELKNLFDFLVPGYLGSDEYFRKHFMIPIQNRDVSRELSLQKLIHPLKLRRTKRQVLSDLPAKVEDVRHCGLSQEQVRLYREVVQMRARPLLSQMSDESVAVPYLHVFAVLQLLKQVCNHPALLRKNTDYQKYESGKFELLKELIGEALDSGDKIVIFSQYIGMIDIIGAYCRDIGVGHVLMTGQTRNRGKVIESFQTDPQIRIFIGSLMAGGVGIDLTAASVVIHYDRWWNASKEDQATDRVHRIGQKNFVQVMKLVTRGTLEEKIDQMISRKQGEFNKFLEKDEEIFKSLSRHDLIELLR
ncbi:MAG: DEAD/DEAH box helicase [Deltaproteobacteria bacterium]|nr:DEAD/DEAH box helicase [Deltaproteobacteria bacterium]